MRDDSSRYVVTGGGGFVGRALCKRLIDLGHSVTAISRGSYPELEKLGVRTVRADIAEYSDKLEAAFDGARCVFHTAAKVEMWGPYREFFRVNVEGTRNVIRACRARRVSSLVFTSSPSVVASGEDLLGVDESTPYPAKFHASYPETKALAEQEVIAANGPDIATVALRPHLIFGPGDTNLEPLVVKRARAGRLWKIGNGENLADFSFIEDCVSAHILAAGALESNPACRGKVYFISQGRPVRLWDWIDAALGRNGLPPVRKSLPRKFAVGVGALFEGLARIFPIQPPITKFLAEELSTSHYFDIAAARRDLGYDPVKSDLLNW